MISHYACCSHCPDGPHDAHRRPCSATCRGSVRISSTPPPVPTDLAERAIEVSTLRDTMVGTLRDTITRLTAEATADAATIARLLKDRAKDDALIREHFGRCLGVGKALNDGH